MKNAISHCSIKIKILEKIGFALTIPQFFQFNLVYCRKNSAMQREKVAKMLMLSYTKLNAYKNLIKQLSCNHAGLAN